MKYVTVVWYKSKFLYDDLEYDGNCFVIKNLFKIQLKNVAKLKKPCIGKQLWYYGILKADIENESHKDYVCTLKSLEE